MSPVPQKHNEIIFAKQAVVGYVVYNIMQISSPKMG